MASEVAVTDYDELDQAVLAALRLEKNFHVDLAHVAHRYTSFGLKEPSIESMRFGRYAYQRACELLAKLWWDGEVSAIVGETLIHFLQSHMTRIGRARERRHYELRLGKLSFSEETMVDKALHLHRPALPPYKPQPGSRRLSRRQRKAEADMMVIPAGADRESYELAVRTGKKDWRRSG